MLSVHLAQALTLRQDLDALKSGAMSRDQERSCAFSAAFWVLRTASRRIMIVSSGIITTKLRNA